MEELVDGAAAMRPPTDGARKRRVGVAGGRRRCPRAHPSSADAPSRSRTGLLAEMSRRGARTRARARARAVVAWRGGAAGWRRAVEMVVVSASVGQAPAPRTGIQALELRSQDRMARVAPNGSRGQALAGLRCSAPCTGTLPVSARPMAHSAFGAGRRRGCGHSHCGVCFWPRTHHRRRRHLRHACLPRCARRRRHRCHACS